MIIHTGPHMLSARTVGSVSFPEEHGWRKASLVQSHPCCLLGCHLGVRDTPSLPFSWRRLVGTAQSKADEEANSEAMWVITGVILILFPGSLLYSRVSIISWVRFFILSRGVLEKFRKRFQRYRQPGNHGKSKVVQKVFLKIKYCQ